jgi:predicted SAM-dependent methyltransferase
MTTGQQRRRLNWGCGTEPTPGWINSDIKEDPTVDISCDILEGLPLEEGSIDYAVSIHALPELRYPDQVPALMELRRVLTPGGVLRLALPDLDRAIDAYKTGDRAYFLVPDEDARALGSKLIVQLLWYGYSKTLFTFDFIAELLEKAGFADVRRCEFGQTHSPHPEIASLDNRPRESLFVEARK